VFIKWTYLWENYFKNFYLIMLWRKKSYLFSKNFYIFYFKFFLFLIGDNGYFILKLPKIFYEKINSEKISLIFISYYHFQSFLKSILTTYDRFFLYYFFRLKIKGLGFRFKRINKSLYRFYFVFVNFYYFHLPPSVILKRKGRTILFFSSNFWVLQTLISKVVLLKATTVYRRTGLLFPKRIVTLKIGKKKLK